MIVHGTLHILGYDHSGTLEESSEEEMFLLQEDLLLNTERYVHCNWFRNFTKEYENTPHNAGYVFVDCLREYLLKEVI